MSAHVVRWGNGVKEYHPNRTDMINFIQNVCNKRAKSVRIYAVIHLMIRQFHNCFHIIINFFSLYSSLFLLHLYGFNQNPAKGMHLR